MTDPTSFLVDACGRIADRHDGCWRGTLDAFTGHLVDIADEPGSPSAAQLEVAAFHLFRRALTPAGASFVTSDGRALSIAMATERGAAPGGGDVEDVVTIVVAGAAADTAENDDQTEE